MPGLVGPDRFPIRRPDDTAQMNGRNVNPVRVPEMGGQTASRWTGGDDSKKNNMSVERATSVRAARQASKTDD